MINSINDKLRNKLLNNDSILITLIKLEQMNIEEREDIIRLLLSDYFKIKFFEEVGKSNFIINTNIEKLINKFIMDEDFTYDVVKNSITFNKLSNISKIVIIEEIEKNNKDKYFNTLSKTHILDKLVYRFDYSLKSFEFYYKDYTSKVKEKKHITDVTIFIANKVLELKNSNEYKKMILEFIKIYYKWNIFIKEIFSEMNLYKEDYLYLEMIKHNTLEDLINYSKINFNFLTSILENYLYYSTVQKVVSGPIVDKYFNENVDDEIKKKLKIKEN